MTKLDMNFVGPQQPESHPQESHLPGPHLAKASNSEQHAVAHADNENKNSFLARKLSAIQDAASIAGILRMGGAALIVTSLSVFLIQGVDAASDLQRYLLLLAQTLLLTCTGLGVGYLLKEPRGARVFLSLGLISIPANFAVLGAMIYSIVPLDSLLTHYPSYASWQSTSIKELAIAVSAGLAILVPMSVFCFAVLERRSKWWLSITYFAACVTLLIPLRESLSITIISGLSAVGIVALLQTKKAHQPTISTGEGKFVKALLFLPIAIMLARSAILYDSETYLALMVLSALYCILRHFVIHGSDVRMINMTIELLTAITAMALATFFSVTAIQALHHIHDVFPVFVLFQLVLLTLNVELGRHIKSMKMQTLIHAAWAALSLSCVAMYTAIDTTSDSLWTGLAASAILLIGGTVIRQRIAVIFGILCLAIALLARGDELWAIFQGTGWLGMATTGMFTILAGSILERFWPAICAFLQSFNARKSQPIEK